MGNLKDLVKKNKKYIKEQLDLNILIDEHLRKKNSKQRPSNGVFHPSVVSKGIECPRWYVYSLGLGLDPEISIEENYSAASLTGFVVGQAIHDAFHKVFYDMKILEGLWECKKCGFQFWANSPHGQCFDCGEIFSNYYKLIFKEVPLNNGLISGHADGILDIGGIRYLLELKSIKNVEKDSYSTWGFENIGDQPLNDHYMQTQLYLELWRELVEEAQWSEIPVNANEKGIQKIKTNGPTYTGARTIGNINKAIVLYIAKNTGDRKLFVVDRASNSIKHLMGEMKSIFQAWEQKDIDSVPALCYTLTDAEWAKKRCKYKPLCEKQWRKRK